ncbi:MAG TPA: ABC transporter permease [Candidatus Acidoferrum sp.]|nr:ABC transporter permease [Candidatus Acidoferrum sp.]
MTAPVGTNRKMFWRIIRRLLFAHRGRLFVILLALGTGAAVSAALLNLQVDAKRRLTSEFRVLGANVTIAARGASDSPDSPKVLSESLFGQLPAENEGNTVTKAEFLYGIVDVAPLDPKEMDAKSHKSTKAVVAGFAIAVGSNHVVHGLEKISPSTIVEGKNLDSLNVRTCEIGQSMASELDLHPGASLAFKNGERADSCSVSAIRSFGGPEDNQVFLELPAVQALLNLPRQVSLIQASVPGTPQSIDRYIAALVQAIPNADVRPIRQFTEAEAKIYDRISGLLTATVALVLLLTGLCVMAAMTNVAMERRNDVGLMKAIGGASRRVLRLFLAEAALLGLTGGLLGAAAGIVLSIGLGKAVFGVAARPRLIVYPVAVALTIIVAIAGAFPLRRLTSIRPASVFRGEA